MDPAADRGDVTPLLAALLVAFAPQLVRLPLPVTAWCLALWGYTGLADRRGWPLPGRVARWALTAAGIGLVLLSHGFLQRSGFSIAMLAVMAGLKPMEVRTHRDRMVTVFLAYFLAITSLFDFENLAMTGFMFLSVLVTTAVLIRQNHPDGRMADHLRTSAVIMAQAVPLMLVLFVLFPRTGGGAWGLAAPGVGVTGFSDILRLGDVSSLVRSDRVAFRAEFGGDIPPPDRLYWRGVVFEDYDGTSWRPAGTPGRTRSPVAGDQSVAYGISLEAYDGRYLFALDLPLEAPAAAVLMDDYTLRARRGLAGKTRYRVTSVTRYVTEDSRVRRRAALELPEGVSPRARRLAAEWKRQGRGAAQTTAEALAYFAANGFVYTLSPPAGGQDAVDDFLFGHRRGFCEHFASAFVFLMRAAGVPARLVGGFLGGERNPYGNYLVVRDSHAHSWAEVWIDGEGWVRVDPTLAVAPERAVQGLEGPLFGGGAGILENLPGGLARAWMTLGDAWELINIRWDFEVMGYSSDEQQDLLRRAGIRGGAWRTPAIMLVLTVSALGLLYAGLRWRRARRKMRRGDPVQDAYARFCARLEAAGLPRRPSQGPVDYAGMVASEREDLRDAVMPIVDLYVRLRYGGEKGEGTLRAFQDRVRRFDPPRADPRRAGRTA